MISMYLFGMYFRKCFFLFLKRVKKQSYQGYPLKYLLSSGAILMESQKDKGDPLAALECIEHK